MTYYFKNCFAELRVSFQVTACVDFHHKIRTGFKEHAMRSNPWFFTGGGACTGRHVSLL